MQAGSEAPQRRESQVMSHRIVCADGPRGSSQAAGEADFSVSLRVCESTCVRACVDVSAWTPLSARGAARALKITVSQHIWGKNDCPPYISGYQSGRGWGEGERGKGVDRYGDR